MKSSVCRINSIFYVSTILAYMLLLVPIEYKILVYSPSLLGYFWLFVTIPVSVISLIYLLYMDIRAKKYNSLVKRIIFYIALLVLFVLTSLYLRYNYHNLTWYNS